ncbi:hypothetical protein IWX48DRAFT_199135 [Phyllosticta citricarpa]
MMRGLSIGFTDESCLDFRFFRPRSCHCARGGLYHIAVISGSSSGIGASIARELSARGASIVVNYPFAQLSEEAHKVAESLQTPSIAVEADMSSIDGPAKLVGSAVGKFGRIEIVVNNAALAVNAQLGELPLDHWDKLVNLNGRGVFLLS